MVGARGAGVTLYLARRLALAVVIVSVAMAILFSAVHLVPGDPASVALGPRATPEMREEFRVRMGLDRPLPVQFLRFAGNVLRGDLGTDIWSRQSVAGLVWRALPSTVALTALGIGWAVLVGIPLGCFSAAHRGSWLDRATGVLSVSAIALPSFIVAIYALLVFAVWLKWFPAIGAGRPGDLGNQLWHLVLPSFAIGLGWVGSSRGSCVPPWSRCWGRATSGRPGPSGCPSGGSSIATRSGWRSCRRWRSWGSGSGGSSRARCSRRSSSRARASAVSSTTA
jgi:ABC-type microcin C transport system permease subunit YejB